MTMNDLENIQYVCVCVYICVGGRRLGGALEAVLLSVCTTMCVSVWDLSGRDGWQGLRVKEEK